MNLTETVSIPSHQSHTFHGAGVITIQNNPDILPSDHVIHISLSCILLPNIANHVP